VLDRLRQAQAEANLSCSSLIATAGDDQLFGTILTGQLRTKCRLLLSATSALSSPAATFGTNSNVRLGSSADRDVGFDRHHRGAI